MKTPSVIGPKLGNKLDSIAKQCVRNGVLHNREFLSCCAKEFDQALSVLVSQLKLKIMDDMDKMDEKLHSVERGLRLAIKKCHDDGEEAMGHAQSTADAEREEKAMLVQWLNSFLVSASSAPSLSSMEFAFTRFALNMALSAASTIPEVMMDAGVPSFLVSMLGSPNELITGPAALALSQIVQHEACQESVMQRGGIAPLVNLSLANQSPAVLRAACTALASIAQFGPSKATLAGKGCIKVMIQLCAEFQHADRVTAEVAGDAASCLVNCTYKSDANRNLAVECGVVEPLVALLETDCPVVLTQACRLAANLAFNNMYTAFELLKHGFHTTLCEALEALDFTQHSDILEAGFVALGNVSNNEMNMAQVGASPALSLAVRACVHCTSPRVVRAATQAISSLCFNCHANQTRCGTLGAVEALLDVGYSWGCCDEAVDGADNLEAASSALHALSQLVMHPTNVLTAREIGALDQVLQVVNIAEHNGVLKGAAMVIVAMIPEPSQIVRSRRDGREPYLGGMGAIDGLGRCQDWVFGRAPPPAWLLYGIEVLSMAPEQLEMRCAVLDDCDDEDEKKGHLPLIRPQFNAHHAYFEEYETAIPPDIEVCKSEELCALLFHVY
ncbi:unnamed protein product [Chrysoparadoxa australica]